MKARKAMFAGSWYPGNPSECEEDIKKFLKEGKADEYPERKFIGGIVPHAGWFFSGSIACNVIHQLLDEAPPDVMVIFGMHLRQDSPCFIMAEGAWETPFGELEIETSLASELLKKFEFQIETAEQFTQDNTIELQLPFVKYFFRDTKIVPIGVPPTENALEIGKAVADISASMGMRLRVIGSTDLTHYGANYGFSPKGRGPAAIEWARDENDRKVIDAMLAMDPSAVIREGLANHNACCAGAAATAIASARQLGAEQSESVAYASSYDKHPGDSFVGYVGIVFGK
ncbi:MAG: AmmeMemoRadiSam system protein B [Desulfobacteraceae bacterium 4572_88]|nr:MAG: AmmeMemoRadiSam system protein B [Desulfobacteraceae bacterium 4572_88]